MNRRRTLKRWVTSLAITAAAVASMVIVTGSAAAKDAPKGQQIVLYAIECEAWKQVPANEDPTSWDETGHGAQLNGSADVTLADAADIPDGCEGDSDWTFAFSTGNNAAATRTVSVSKTQTVTLTAVEARAVADDGLWVRAYSPKGSQFAGLRCYDDVLFGDSTEVVRAPADVTPVCIVYTVKADDTPQELTLLAADCEEWTAVPANADPTTWDDTGNGKELNSSADTSLADPSDIPDGCDKAENVVFDLTAASDGAVLMSEKVSSRNGKTVKLEGKAAAALSSGGIFVRVTEKKGYAFAGLRCYDDVLFSDNLELIYLPPGERVTGMYCIAFFVKQ